MKKVLLILLCVVAIAVVTKAQTHFIGGSFSMWNNDDYDGGYTSVDISPRYGYNLNSKWAVGLALSYQHGVFNNGVEKEDENKYGVTPFLRYSFLVDKPVVLFADLMVGYSVGKHEGNIKDVEEYSAMLRPAIAYIFNNHFSMAAYIINMGYRYSDHPYASYNSNGYGFEMNMKSMSLGLKYTF